MADIKRAQEEFVRRMTGVTSGLVKIIQDNRTLVAGYISDQLYSGVDGNEKELAPDYLHDPYFNKWGKRADRVARGYMAWKMRITPPVRSFIGLDPRKPNVPNLYINGHYHSRITVNAKQGGVSIGNSAGFAGEIEAKYGSDIYKVSPTATKHFIDEHVREFLARMLNPRG